MEITHEGDYTRRTMSEMPMGDAPLVPLEDRPLGRNVLGIFSPAGVMSRVALILAAALGCLIFGIGSQLFDLPALPGFDGSLLLQPSPVGAILIAGVLFLIATLVCTVIAAAVHFEAGLFGAAIGMMVLSVRCGTIQAVLFESGGSESVYFRLIVEVVLLAVILGIAWLMLRQIGRVVHGADAVAAESNLLNNLTATVAQAVVTGIVILVLCQSEAKNQCLASVALGSIIGSIVAYRYAAASPSIWYWTGPLLVGIIGYALAATGQDSNLAIGSPTGMFAPLARPLPLDYASVGVAGAIFGYWASRKPAGG